MRTAFLLALLAMASAVSAGPVATKVAPLGQLIDPTGASDNDVLVYDSATNKWTPATQAGAGGGVTFSVTPTTDNRVVRTDGTSGDVVQQSGLTLDDSDNLSGITLLTSTNVSSTAASATTAYVTTLDPTAAQLTITDNVSVTGSVSATDFHVGGSITDSDGDIGSSGQFLSSTGAGGTNWSTPAGSGDVNGPGSATDNALTLFDGTGGKTIKNQTAWTIVSGNLVGTENASVTKGVSADDVYLTGAISLNGDVGTSGQVLTSNDDGSATWEDAAAGSFNGRTSSTTDGFLSANGTAASSPAIVGSGVASLVQPSTQVYLDSGRIEGVTAGTTRTHLSSTGLAVNTSGATAASVPLHVTGNATVTASLSVGSHLHVIGSITDSDGDIGSNGQFLSSTGAGGTNWSTPSGAGDVSAASNLDDNKLVRGDGGAKGVQHSGITVDDSDNVSGVVLLSTTNISATGAVGSAILHVTGALTDADGDVPSAGKVLTGTAAGATDWVTASTGDVTAASSITDNRITRGDGGSKGIQESGVSIDDSDNVSGVVLLSTTNVSASGSISGVNIYATGAITDSDGDIGSSGQVLSSTGAGGTNWSAAGTGDVAGPGSATDNAIALFNGTGGKTIKNQTTWTIDGTDLAGNATFYTDLIREFGDSNYNINLKDGSSNMVITPGTSGNGIVTLGAAGAGITGNVSLTTPGSISVSGAYLAGPISLTGEVGTEGQVLTSHGTVAPTWETPSAGSFDGRTSSTSDGFLSGNGTAASSPAIVGSGIASLVQPATQLYLDTGRLETVTNGTTVTSVTNAKLDVTGNVSVTSATSTAGLYLSGPLGLSGQAGYVGSLITSGGAGAAPAFNALNSTTGAYIGTNGFGTGLHLNGTSNAGTGLYTRGTTLTTALIGHSATVGLAFTNTDMAIITGNNEMLAFVNGTGRLSTQIYAAGDTDLKFRMGTVAGGPAADTFLLECGATGLQSRFGPLGLALKVGSIPGAATVPLDVTGSVSITSGHLTTENVTRTVGSVPVRLDGLIARTVGDGPTLASSDAEAVIETLYSCPSSGLTAGSVLHVKAWGAVGSTGTPAISFRLRYGGLTGTVIAQTGTLEFLPPGSAGWRLDADIIVRAAGEGGLVASNMLAYQDVNQLAKMEVLKSAVNLSVAGAIVLTAQWDTSDASNTITVEGAVLSGVN